MERSAFTLLELTRRIGTAIRDSFPGRYWLIAEINEIRENINEHCYLELIEKDPEKDKIVARSKATIWAYTWRMLRPYFETSTSQPLAKGMMILIEVSIEFHELYGISLNIRDIDPVYTIGDLERKRVETIKKLKDEGIINMNKSLQFPILPKRIAVISSPLAAGYEDFLHQITNNQKKYSFSLTIFPALMQGDNAGKSVTDALDSIFQLEGMFDLVIILRGGGSASDLNCFNSYEIAAHIAQFPLPVITGIGHERDHTIAGMVANTDLKTPTAVAEFLLGKFNELDQKLGRLSNRLTVEISDILQQNTHKLYSEQSHLQIIIKNYFTGLKKSQQNLITGILPDTTRSFIRKKSDNLLLANRTVGLIDPVNILKKGYSLVIKNGIIVKTSREINLEDILETKFHDGRIESKVLKVNVNLHDLKVTGF